MTTITAKNVRIANFSNTMRNDYRVKRNLFRRENGETVEDIMGYCLDATDEIPAGGIVERSAGAWGDYPSETVPR